MFSLDLKRSLAAVAVAAGVLAAAGPASAASYQHNQTNLEFRSAAVSDGTSNTIMFGERAVRSAP